MTTNVNDQANLTLGGIDVLGLLTEYGSPLYVFDEATLRTMCRQFVSEFATLYPKSKVLYASKAFVNPAIVQLVTEEGLGHGCRVRRRGRHSQGRWS